jgi:mono/diheme cytochrome c family protein
MAALTAAVVVVGAAAQKETKSADIAAVYKKQCALCHGVDGSGNTAMGKSMKLRSLKSDEVQKLSDAELFDIIAKGKGKMPGYARLGDDTVRGLVAYTRQLAKAK